MFPLSNPDQLTQIMKLLYIPLVPAALAVRIVSAQWMSNSTSTTVLPVMTVSSCPASENAPHTFYSSRSIVPVVSTYLTVCSQPVETGFVPVTYTITETCPCHLGSPTGVPVGFTTAIASVDTQTQLITCPVASISAFIQSGFVQAHSSTGADIPSINPGTSDSGQSTKSFISEASQNTGNIAPLTTNLQSNQSPPRSTSEPEAGISVTAAGGENKSNFVTAPQTLYGVSDHAGSSISSVFATSSVHTGFSMPSLSVSNTTAATSSMAIYTGGATSQTVSSTVLMMLSAAVVVVNLV